MPKILSAVCFSFAGIAILFHLAIPAAPTSEPVTREESAEPPETADLQTFGSIGKEVTLLEAGREAEIFHHEGSGCLTHMWFAMDERTRIRVYVDGETAPSIDMATDLGHGYYFGTPKEPWGVEQMGRLGGVYNNFRIPFGKSVRVTVLPTTEVFDRVNGRKAWWIIRGTEHLPVVLGGVRLPSTCRLKLYRLEDYRAQPLEEFTLCETKRSGALYLVTLAANGEETSGDWKDQSYQESCVRAYFGDSRQPTFLSSGLEDYFVSSGYFHHGQTFHTPVSGLTFINRADNAFSAYRFHDTDPVFFQNGMKLTLRCGESLGGEVFHDPPPTTYSVYTWVYEW